jgi:hypothetical protein
MRLAEALKYRHFRALVARICDNEGMGAVPRLACVAVACGQARMRVICLRESFPERVEVGGVLLSPSP